MIVTDLCGFLPCTSLPSLYDGYYKFLVAETGRMSLVCASTRRFLSMEYRSSLCVHIIIRFMLDGTPIFTSFIVTMSSTA